MRILKVIGAIVGVLLLLVAVPVLIGVIGRSAVAIFGLLGLAVAVLLYRWWRNFAQGGRRSRLFGQRERGASRQRSPDESLRQRGDPE